MLQMFCLIIKSISVSATLIYNSKNKVESITQEMRKNPDYNEEFCDKVGQKDGPTHVVSSITRGFRGILKFTKTTRYTILNKTFFLNDNP